MEAFIKQGKTFRINSKRKLSRICDGLAQRWRAKQNAKQKPGKSTGRLQQP